MSSSNFSTEFYIHKLSGEAILVEILEFDDGVSIMLGDIRIDLDLDSALDFADALIQKINELRIEY